MIYVLTEVAVLGSKRGRSRVVLVEMQHSTLTQYAFGGFDSCRASHHKTFSLRIAGGIWRFWGIVYLLVYR